MAHRKSDKEQAFHGLFEPSKQKKHSFCPMLLYLTDEPDRYLDHIADIIRLCHVQALEN